MWPNLKIFNFFKTSRKSVYILKNDEMNMFGEFQLKITPGSAKTVTPFCKNPKNGVSKNGKFSFSRNFSGRNVYLAKNTSLEDANSEI